MLLHAIEPLFSMEGIEGVSKSVAGSESAKRDATFLEQNLEVLEVILLGFFDTVSMQRFVKSAMGSLGVPVKFLREPKGLGTAGGLIHFRSEIEAGDPDLLLLLHGDIACTFPLLDMVRWHLDVCRRRGNDQLCTIMGTHVAPSESHKYGCIVVQDGVDRGSGSGVASRSSGSRDDQNDDDRRLSGQEVLHYVEKPESEVSNLINCGVYCFPTSIIGRFEEIRQKNAQKNTSSLYSAQLLRANTSLHISLERDILTNLAGTETLYCYQLNPEFDFWMQVKTTSDALNASELYLQEKYRKYYPERIATRGRWECELVGVNIIEPTARIHPTAKIGPNVSIGAEAVIGPGVRISDAIILEGCELGDNCFVKDAIIGWNSVVGPWTRIEGTPSSDHTRSEDRTSIVGAGCSIAGELIVRNCIVLPHKELNESVKDRIIL